MYKECIVENCENKPIKSHSIQKALLKKIAIEGHVYSVFYKENDGYSFTKVGVNNATVSPLFCKYHDDKIFKKVEKKVDFKTLDDFDFDILAYRSYVFFYDKKQLERSQQIEVFQSKEYRKIFDLSVLDVVKQIMNNNDLKNMLEVYREVCDFHKEELNKLYTCIYSKTKSNFIHYKIIVPKNLGVVCSTVADPSVDWAGNIVRDIRNEDVNYPPLFITVLSSNEESIILFTCHKKCQNYQEFIDRVLKLSLVEQSYVINKMLYNDAQNLHISPKVYSEIIMPNKEQCDYLLFESEFIDILDSINKEHTSSFDLNEQIPLMFKLE